MPFGKGAIHPFRARASRSRSASVNQTAMALISDRSATGAVSLLSRLPVKIIFCCTLDENALMRKETAQSVKAMHPGKGVGLWFHP